MLILLPTITVYHCECDVMYLFYVCCILCLHNLVCLDYMKKLSVSVDADDELPDYIMVMVANRKTEEQMAEDLSLFLSNNTSKFTTWYVVQVF